MAAFYNPAVGLIAVDEPVEVADIPTIETWDRHDCKVTVTQPEGFLCKVKLRAKIDYPPDEVFELLIHPDNSRYFSTVAAVTYRKTLEDDRRGKKKVEVEQAAQWRFLFLSGYFFTRLFVHQDKPEGVIEFKLAKEGMMKNFEGRWEIRPFDQHSLDEISGKTNLFSNFGYRVRSFMTHSKPQASLLTLEQSVLPKTVPPPWFRGYMAKLCGSIIQTIIRDLRGEIERVKQGKPIPKWQEKKLKQAKRLLNSRNKEREKEAAAVPASLSLRRKNNRIHPTNILF